MVVGWIPVTHDGNGGLKSCDHRHGVGVKKGVKWGSEEDCYLNAAAAGAGWLAETVRRRYLTSSTHAHALFRLDGHTHVKVTHLKTHHTHIQRAGKAALAPPLT